jgi:hypothetical protein
MKGNGMAFRMGRVWACGAAAVCLMVATAQQAHAWGHQGHILITRVAALRIINDPAAPAGLKDFLKANMKYDMEACRKLVEEEDVGADATNYQVGLDGACTWPDRIIPTKEGKVELEPYGAPEAKMHFTDLEWLGKDPVYKADLSNLPKLADVPRDMKDARWKQAGYVPFRVEEMYKKVVEDFGAASLDNAKALKDVGYLVHYVEDAHQPQHSTIDFKSYSYLFGKIKAVHEKKLTVDGKEVVDYGVDRKDSRKINPHGDLEFQIFANTEEPRKTYRAELWKEFTQRVEKKGKEEKAGATKLGTFDRTFEILSDSYHYLPAVGKAAIAGYSSGEFNPQAFFTSKDTVNGEELDTVQLIAERNAQAVIEVERTLRQAWAEAHPDGK